MNLLIISSAPVIRKSDGLYAYAPYVDELSLWAKHVSSVSLCCPQWENEGSLLIKRIDFTITTLYQLPLFEISTGPNIIRSVWSIPKNIRIIYRAMRVAGHIHLRCPGNVGLLACMVQILFPQKKKSAKYAGNWDPNASKPLSYILQQKLLASTRLTKNMSVLVYGKWPKMNSNLVPFFTATYSESEKVPLQPIEIQGGVIKFVFAGMLTAGKNPLYAIGVVDELRRRGYKVQLNIYGDGPERQSIEAGIISRHLVGNVILHGNVTPLDLKSAYQNSHFVILPSNSEGWPKVIAEGMFWGCVPVSTEVSCVPYMLDHGTRGILLTLDIDRDATSIQTILDSTLLFEKLRKSSSDWARLFTTEVFEVEIKTVLQ
jgi:glycosyltransferase involved in cell wall biosynthesis